MFVARCIKIRRDRTHRTRSLALAHLQELFHRPKQDPTLALFHGSRAQRLSPSPVGPASHLLLLLVVVVVFSFFASQLSSKSSHAFKKRSSMAGQAARVCRSAGQRGPARRRSPARVKTPYARRDDGRTPVLPARAPVRAPARGAARPSTRANPQPMRDGADMAEVTEGSRFEQAMERARSRRGVDKRCKLCQSIIALVPGVPQFCGAAAIVSPIG
jgi:hypothetical protein